MRTTVTKFLTPLLFVLMSCGGDDPSQDSPVPEPEDQHCLLQKQITPSLTSTVTRDDAGLPTIINYDYKVGATEFKTAANMEYDASGKLTKIQGQDYSFTFEYDSEGKITVEKYQATFDPQKIYTYPYERSFLYNDEGQLIRITTNANNYERYEYDAEGNLSKKFLKTTTQAEYLTTEYITYDDKKSPYPEFPFQVNIYLGMSEVSALITSLRPVVPENNVLTVKSYSPDGTFTMQNTTYTYNDSGYPTSIQELNLSNIFECD
ncbi:MAG TPA: hypothetical protein VFZ52_23625 [Chryseolinea sp.]